MLPFPAPIYPCESTQRLWTQLPILHIQPSPVHSSPKKPKCLHTKRPQYVPQLHSEPGLATYLLQGWYATPHGSVPAQDRPPITQGLTTALQPPWLLALKTMPSWFSPAWLSHQHSTLLVPVTLELSLRPLQMPGAGPLPCSTPRAPPPGAQRPRCWLQQ